MTVTPLHVGICLLAALVTSIVVRFIVGDARREMWFAQTKSTLINQRGRLGQYLSLGYPKTKQGFVVWLGLVALIVAEIFIIINIEL